MISVNIEIEEVLGVTPELTGAIKRMIPQLTKRHQPPDDRALNEIIDNPNTHLLVARDASSSDNIVGTLTLALYRIPTGVRAWIEDVVVDKGHRGKGIGESLNRYALDYAKKLGADTVNLTSNPSRKAANRLYQRLGFEQREAAVYRYVLQKAGT